MPENAPAAAQRRHWSVAVLALLRERPMHPYEMRRLMRLRHKDERLVLRPGSLYNAVTWLVGEGLIEAVATGQAGRRPQHTVYRLLPAGERQLRGWLGEMVEVVDRDVSSFSVAVDHLVHLSPAEAAVRLEARRARLRGVMDALEATLRTRVESVGRVNLLEVEHDLALFQAQDGWLGRIVAELRSGVLTWDTERILEASRSAAGGMP